MMKRSLFVTGAVACVLTLSLVPTSATGVSGSSAASATAVSAAYPVNTSYKLTVSPVNYGGKYVVTATFPKSFKNRSVTLQMKSGGKWKKVKTVKVAKTGRVAVTVKKAGSTQYRIVSAKWKSKKAFSTKAFSASTQWKTAFSDDFSGKTLNTAKWYNRQVDVYAGSRICAATSTKNATVSGGKAKITLSKVSASSARAKAAVANAKVYYQGLLAAATTSADKAKYTKLVKNPCPYGVFDQGHIATTTQFTHGIIAAKIKFPKQRGQHGGLWLQGMSGEDQVEIDVAEFYGVKKNHKNELTSLLHLPGGTVADRVGGYVKYIPKKTYYSSYHVFSVEWNKSSYIFRVDGVETFRTSKRLTSDPHELILSLLTSDWEMPNLNTKKLPNSMLVDWVRVYQAK
ncbi:MAG: glycoside hydrolase family 16 protein [Propionibacteriaceae bacterium]|jgi:hypothetical protein|nr:glycoside hydrolase family 16 protein [Propionibacteriaceae bacterium]